MIRQRNDTGGVLESHEFGLSIGPGEEFEFRLPVPGCTILGRVSAEDSTPDTAPDITEDPTGEEIHE